MPDISIRRATPEDAEALVDFIDFAAEGLPFHLWAQMADVGETQREVGMRRARREEGGFSYRNAVVAEEGDEVVAGMIGYALPDQPDPIGGDIPPIVLPALELEALACGTWYINVLAANPDRRNRGLGAALLAEAERFAVRDECTGLSLIVADSNTGAIRFYERHGFRESSRRPMVKGGWHGVGEDWVLLTKTL